MPLPLWRRHPHPRQTPSALVGQKTRVSKVGQTSALRYAAKTWELGCILKVLQNSAGNFILWHSRCVCETEKKNLPSLHIQVPQNSFWLEPHENPAKEVRGYLFMSHMCVWTVVPWHAATMCLSEMELGYSGLEAKTLIRQIISLPQLPSGIFPFLLFLSFPLSPSSSSSLSFLLCKQSNHH